MRPDKYKEIQTYLKKQHKRRSEYIIEVQKKIEKILHENKINAKVEGREKSLSSIFKKMRRYLRQGKIHSESEFGRIYDNYAFRIITKTKEECYKTLGLIHATWHPLISEFDDYIANPKPNGYKSLQTTVFCEKGKLAEIQIKTENMHLYNEYGPASHISYKIHDSEKSLSSTAFNWLKNINIFRRESQQKSTEDKYKIELFQNNIFVLTPTNEVKKLPLDATPVDFAYAIHTEIGNKCRGAKVNDKMVPLEHTLKTGDQVEIIIDKRVKYPKSKWLEFVVSNQTASKIKSEIRKKERREATQKGYERLNKALKPYNTDIKKLYRERSNDIDIIIFKNNSNNLDGLLAKLGFDLINTDKIIDNLFPHEEKDPKKKLVKARVSIEGSTQTEYSIAKCCNPTPKDDIVALTTITKGIRIHSKDCIYFKKFPKDRILNAKWVV